MMLASICYIRALLINVFTPGKNISHTRKNIRIPTIFSTRIFYVILVFIFDIDLKVMVEGHDTF